MNELMFRSATDLAALIRAGELHPRELVETCLTSIDRIEPTINAFTHVAHDAAMQAAQRIEPGDPRPFAGVPIAIKDNRAVKDMPLTICSELFGDYVADHDAFLVRRLKDAGFVIVGKTALPEMGILPTTESRRFGPTNNPWALDRTPGGSSGGSAAAVAAGMVPIAHGNDGGGSTRIPAACCGLVGLKPARGRVSVGPDSGQSFLTADGVLTRTVSDTAHAIDILAGYEFGDATWAPPPPEPYAQSMSSDPGRLNVGFTLDGAIDDVTLDPTCEDGARKAAHLLESLGHTVTEITAPWANLSLLSEFTRLFGPMVSLATFTGGQLAGREPTEQDVEPLTWALWERARQQDTVTFLAAQSRAESIGRRIVEALSPYDIVLTPALAKRPLHTGEVHGRGPDPWGHFRRSGEFTPYTAIVNVTGLPAISLPLYHGEDGMPLAVQLIGRPANERTLLQVAAQLEQAQPWSSRRPESL